jgi:HAD superfamily hydrolase (TIGR01509 family)
MTIPINRIEAVCFDLGNTLIEFGPRQMAHQFAALKKALESQFGHCDLDGLTAIRDRQLAAPFSNGFVENDLRTICRELVVGLYGVQPDEVEVDRLMEARFKAFVEVVELPDGVLSLLEQLRRRYRLALLSNYPCSRSILACLEKIGLADYFESRTISGDVGYVKPHPKPYEVMLADLDLAPERCVHVGDNWLADVQGSKRMGMVSIHTTQYAPYETIIPVEGDSPPDLHVEHIRDLEAVFL